MSHFSVAVFSHSSEDVEKLLEPFNECTEDPRYLEWETNDEWDFDEEKGECGRYVNPNAKWDWLQMGGRFSDMLKLKDGERWHRRGIRSWENRNQPHKEGFCDQAIVKDVDFTQDFDVWAFLTPEGEWVEKGEVLWFGLSDSTEESSEAHHEELMRLIAENPDLYITIVDCHI